MKTGESVRPSFTFAEIREAQRRIAGPFSVRRWSVSSWDPAFPTSGSKLEVLQPIECPTSCAARPTLVAMLSGSERKRGVWTISAGNAGQGVAYAARAAGVPCTVVAIETAPTSEARKDEGAGRPTGTRAL
jgi:threonine dehydratase